MVGINLRVAFHLLCDEIRSTKFDIGNKYECLKLKYPKQETF
jgi:hypothetical protein